MDDQLERYLNDHLAGSTGALHLILKIADHFEDPKATSFFLDLKEKVEEERELLIQLHQSIETEPSALLKVAGGIAGWVGTLKFMWEGIEPGGLGLFESIEILATGIHGKCLLWQVLGEIQPNFPEWENHDFAKLEREAVTQRDGVEYWRLEVARETFARNV